MTIDTNILIAYLGGDARVREAIIEWKRIGRVLFISAVTECELLSYPKLSSAEEAKIGSFLQENFVTIPFDSSRARRAALIRRYTPRLKLPDAAVAAIALETQTPLVTRNLRDFKKIPELQVFSL